MEEDLRSSGAGLRGFKSHPRHLGNHLTCFSGLDHAKPLSEDILVVKLFMKNDGYPDSTIDSTVKRLKHLATESNLRDSVSVKAFLASKNVSSGFKSNLCDAYGHFLDCHGLSWSRHRYKREKGLPKVPSTARAMEKSSRTHDDKG